MTQPVRPLDPIAVSDPAGAADDLVASLPGTTRLPRGEPVAATAGALGAQAVHLVVPDDGSDLPIDPAPEPSEAFRAAVDAVGDLAALPPATAPRAVVLDGCYQPELAERLVRRGISVLGLPGRLGRERSTAFAAAWYAAATTSPLHEAFEQALTGTGLLDMPDQLQPRWHDPGPVGREPRPVPEGAESPDVAVWYGTNRRPGTARELYTAEPDDELHVGRCVVTVPLSVPMGRLRGPRPGWFGRPTRYRIEHHETCDDLAALRAELGAEPAGTRSVLVYVHGYSTRFTEALTRAAQLHSDLKHPGRAAVFSWPSRGVPTAGAYWTDEESVQHAERYLLRFLTRLRDDAGADRIDVLAHSMGNRAMLRVAMRIADGAPGTEGLRLGNVVLAAADVGQRFFRTEAVAYPRISEAVTAYVSRRDRALLLSKRLHGVGRAGLAPPALVPGIHTVDASALDLGLLGHGYHAQAWQVLGDINAVLHGRPDPAGRAGLTPAADAVSGEKYWRFRA